MTGLELGRAQTKGLSTEPEMPEVGATKRETKMTPRASEALPMHTRCPSLCLPAPRSSPSPVVLALDRKGETIGPM